MVSLFSFGKKADETPLPRTGEGGETSGIPGFPFETAGGSAAVDPGVTGEEAAREGEDMDELKALREEFDGAVKQALEAFHRYVAAVGEQAGRVAVPPAVAPVAEVSEPEVAEAAAVRAEAVPAVLGPMVAERLNASLAAAFGAPPASVAAVPAPAPVAPPVIPPAPTHPHPVSQPVSQSQPLVHEPIAAPLEVSRPAALSVPPPTLPVAPVPAPAPAWAAAAALHGLPPTIPGTPTLPRVPDPVFTPPASIPPVLPAAAKAPIPERPLLQLPPVGIPAPGPAPVAPAPVPVAPPAQSHSPFTIVREGPRPPAAVPPPASAVPAAPAPAPAPAPTPNSLPFSPFQGLEPVPPPPPFMNQAPGESHSRPAAQGLPFQSLDDAFSAESGRSAVLGTVVAGGSPATQQEFLGAMQATLATQRFEPSPTHAFPMPAHLESPFHAAFAPNGPVAPPSALPPVVPPQPPTAHRLGQDAPGRRA